MDEPFIDHVNTRIPEDGVDDALGFYRDILGLEPWRLEEFRADERTSFFFRIGDNALINIRPVDDFERPDRSNYDHFCIVLEADVSELRKDLESEGFSVLREGNPLGTQGRAPAIYVEDPFGYVIELKQLKE